MSNYHWLLYCRPGFETDLCNELLDLSPGATASSAGLVWFRSELKIKPRFEQLIFARQLLRIVGELNDLPERDRLTPLVEAIAALPQRYGELWLETADDDAAKELSSFCRRFGELLRQRLQQEGLLLNDPHAPRLHLLFTSRQQCWLADSQPGNRSDWPMGIPRLRMPSQAPSRSTLKLAEALLTLMTPDEVAQRMKEGMKGVDLGAAPGGWTWQLVNRGMKVIAIDNGPMKGVLADHPAVEHRREDGFRFTPKQPVEWLVCDMIEQPKRIADLVARWFERSLVRQSIFNLKLPMKKRAQAVQDCLDLIRSRLDAAGISYELRCKHLYHDREEITCYLSRVSSKPAGRRKR